jgi:hypothetical protein
MGSWNFEELGNWDIDTLAIGGFGEEMLEGLNQQQAFLMELLGKDGGEDAEQGDDDKYTKKVEAPIYEVTGEKPDISELFTNEHTNALLTAIDNADIPEAEKDFLRVAATRHTVFNFANIAEYYAHSSQEVQRLMEDSALIIIDFDRAIELGYVKLSEEVKAQFAREHGSA